MTKHELEADLHMRKNAIEILVLLARAICANYEKQHCACGLVNDYICERCTWMARIDEDLARIGEGAGS